MRARELVVRRRAEMIIADDALEALTAEFLRDRLEQVLERHRARVERALRFGERLAKGVRFGAQIFELRFAILQIELLRVVARARFGERRLRIAHLVECARERLFVERDLRCSLAPRARCVEPFFLEPA